MAAAFAPWLYMLVLLWACFCLGYGHYTGRIDLWQTITTTKDSKTYVDAKKLAFIGAFVVMATGFAYLAMIEKLTEWYAMIFVSAWVTGKFLGDREQRLNKAIEQSPKGP